jgi:hypothetical protein
VRLALLVAMTTLAAACGSSGETPIRNPLAEESGTPTASATIPPVVTAPPTPRSDIAPPAAELEPAAGRATTLLAEWLAVPERDLSVVASESVAWPSSCLGVEYPGTVCASVVTPGFRVLLRDRMGGLHAVHLDAGSGDARWAGEARAEGAMTQLDRAAQRATIDVSGRTLEVRLAPGTRWLPDPTQAGTVGARVVVAYDPSGNASTPVAAWIALDAS